MTRWVLVVPVWFVFNLALDETTARSHANPGSRLRLPRPEPRTSCFGDRRQARHPARGARRSPQPEPPCPIYTRSMGLGRLLIVLGLVLVALGLLVSLAGRLPFKLGRLPGDIYIQGKHSSFYFPLATCVLLSLLLSMVFWIFRK